MLKKDHKIFLERANSQVFWPENKSMGGGLK